MEVSIKVSLLVIKLMEMVKSRIYIVIYSKLNKTKQMMEKTLDVS